MEKIKQEKLNNKGFSLVELLAAVAILSVIAVPIMRSFSTAAVTTSRAQSVQNATSVAEKIIESVKAKPESELSFSEIEIRDEGGSVTGSYQASRIKYLGETATSGEQFDVYVEISNQEYDAEDGQDNVSDINAVKLPELYSINSEDHFVISWEMNNYDGSAVDNLAYKANKSKSEVKSSGSKTTKITLSGGGSDSSPVNCNCQVIYEVDGVELKYTVFNKSAKDIAIEEGKKSSGGPHLYLFYTTSDQTNSSDYFVNEVIEIEDNTSEPSSGTNKYKQDMYIIMQNNKGNTYVPTIPKVKIYGTAISPLGVTSSEEIYDSDELLVNNGGIFEVPQTISKHNYWIINVDSINEDNNSCLYTNFGSFNTDESKKIDASLYESKEKKRIFNINVRVYKAGTYSDDEWPAENEDTKKFAELNSTMRAH